ncbi:hypothetical protein ACFSLT_30995 [Novosphingobium resinovorum]
MAMGVDRTDVGAVIPPVGVEGLGGLFRILVIAVEQVVAADKDFAALVGAFPSPVSASTIFISIPASG